LAWPSFSHDDACAKGDRGDDEAGIGNDDATMMMDLLAPPFTHRMITRISRECSSSGRSLRTFLSAPDEDAAAAAADDDDNDDDAFRCDDNDDH
jgi:hypothetical protein